MTLLELSGVVKRFGGLPAVDGVSLSVDEGEIVALVGPNGAGKTTLLRAVIGLDPPTAGSIRFMGADVTRLTVHRTRRTGVSMVLQTPRPFAGMTVRENAALGALFGSVGGRVAEPEALERADEALEFVGLAGHADDDARSLNLHEQRFLELARALAGRPRLLLLDEVMAGPQRHRAAGIHRHRAHRPRPARGHGDLGRARDEGGDEPGRARRGPELRPGDRRRHARRWRCAILRSWRRTSVRTAVAMLEVAELSAGYLGEDVVHEVSFAVAEGEAVAVIGSNGAGKTTLFRAVCGLLRPSRGSVRLDGRPITRRRAHDIARRGLAYVPAERHLFPDMTVAENLDLGAFPRRPRAERQALVLELFPRLAERRRQRAGTLSGGEQQMLAVGRALMSEPRLLLLDEPTTGLAPTVAAAAYAALTALREQGLTIVVAEQQVPLALGFADRGYVLESGRIQLGGSVAELEGNSEVQRAYLGVA